MLKRCKSLSVSALSAGVVFGIVAIVVGDSAVEEATAAAVTDNRREAFYIDRPVYPIFATFNFQLNFNCIVGNLFQNPSLS